MRSSNQHSFYSVADNRFPRAATCDAARRLAVFTAALVAIHKLDSVVRDVAALGSKCLLMVASMSARRFSGIALSVTKSTSFVVISACVCTPTYTAQEHHKSTSSEQESNLAAQPPNVHRERVVALHAARACGDVIFSSSLNGGRAGTLIGSGIDPSPCSLLVAPAREGGRPGVGVVGPKNDCPGGLVGENRRCLGKCPLISAGLALSCAASPPSRGCSVVGTPSFSGVLARIAERFSGDTTTAALPSLRNDGVAVREGGRDGPEDTASELCSEWLGVVDRGRAGQ